MAQVFINNFEVLQNYGSFGCSEAIAHTRFRADLGEGYKQSLLFGAKTGLKSWKLTYKTLIQTLDKIGYIGSDAFPLADYYWDFYCRAQVTGIPFVIISLRNSQYYLAEFADENLSFELFATRLYTIGVNLTQRRLVNTTVFDVSKMTGSFHWYDPSQLGLEDGASVSTLPELMAIINDHEAPTVPELTATGGSGEITYDWTESVDTGSGLSHYILEVMWPEEV